MCALHERDAGMLVWWASEVECVSALSRVEREGRLSSRASDDAFRRLDALRSGWSEIQPLDVVRRTAKRLLRVHPLRTADSFQLAAALAAAEGDPASLEIVTLDGRLGDAARREGFSITDVT